MKNLCSLFLCFCIGQVAFSQCPPPSGHANLDVNNVNARMNVGGGLWGNLSTNTSSYEVPKGSGTHSLYRGALWIGGKNELNEVHLAAVRFRQNGNDFWPGPISNNGTIAPDQCVDNDRIYKLNRWEVEEFRQRFSSVGYVIPQDILEWPATDNPHSIVHANAPFIDVNNDGIYNAHDGDYPAFAFDEPVDKDFHLLGDQCLWWVENDVGGPHTETGGTAMGVELHYMAYAYATCNVLNDQTFYRVSVTNKSQHNYHETYLGIWVDSELGYHLDDYVGCEIMRSLGYTYNGNDVDGNGGPGQYGVHPPAVGIGVLRGPLAAPNDGVDNDRNGIIDEPGERLMMSHFIYHNNDGSAQGDPQSAMEYYNYMRAIWRNGRHMCYGGSGDVPNCPQEADFMFPGDSDPLGYGTDGVPQPPWTEQTAGNTPADRRFLISMGPFNLQSGQEEILHFGALWARDTTQTDAFAGAEKLFQVKDQVQDRFENNFANSDCCPPVAQIAYQHYSTHKFLFASIEEGDSYTWDFGDGATWNGRFPSTHHYNYGTYEVCLTVENDCGTSTVCETITVSPPALGVRLKRIEGSGNMGRTLEFKSNMHDTLFITDANRIVHPIYDFNQGPVRIEVLDESLLPQAEMYIALDGVSDSAGWKMYAIGGTDTVYSSSTIGVGDAQLIPQWGLLVQVKQVDNWNEDCDFVLHSSIEQSGTSWLKWLEDTDYPGYTNWIRAGSTDYIDYAGDTDGCFENVLGGTWAPFKLASHADSTASPTWKKFKSLNSLHNLYSVDIVITQDQSKWSRCPVLEIADTEVPSIGNARRFDLRKSPSVDKDGNPDNSGTMGMSWFPGYAVNLETGERLNVAFGENSWLQADNGADMVWNPTATVETQSGDPILGGGHYIYVFGHNGDTPADVPLYDEGQFIFEKLSSNNYTPGDPAKRRVYKDAMWVSIPLLEPGGTLLQSDVKIKMRVRKPYETYLGLSTILNDTLPLYSFTTDELGTAIDEHSITNLDVQVYPNPAIDEITIVNRSQTQIDGLRLYNMSSQLVRSEAVQLHPSHQTKLNVQALPSGIYFLLMDGKTTATVRKVVIQ